MIDEQCPPTEDQKEGDCVLDTIEHAISEIAAGRLSLWSTTRIGRTRATW